MTKEARENNDANTSKNSAAVQGSQQPPDMATRNNMEAKEDSHIAPLPSFELVQPPEHKEEEPILNIKSWEMGDVVMESSSGVEEV